VLPLVVNLVAIALQGSVAPMVASISPLPRTLITTGVKLTGTQGSLSSAVEP
jgi:hypothetical protein